MLQVLGFSGVIKSYVVSSGPLIRSVVLRCLGSMALSYSPPPLPCCCPCCRACCCCLVPCCGPLLCSVLACGAVLFCCGGCRTLCCCLRRVLLCGALLPLLRCPVPCVVTRCFRVFVAGSGCPLLSFGGVLCRWCLCLPACPATLLCAVIFGAPASFSSVLVLSVLFLVPHAVVYCCVLCCFLWRSLVRWCCPVVWCGVLWCPAALCCDLWCCAALWFRHAGPCCVFSFALCGCCSFFLQRPLLFVSTFENILVK